MVRLINHVVDGALVFLFKNRYVNDVLAHKGFAFNFGDYHLTIVGKHNNIINIGAIGNVFFFTKGGSYKTLFSVNVKFGVAHHNFSGVYICKHTHFCFTFFTCSIGFL